MNKQLIKGRPAALAVSVGLSEWFLWRHVFWRDEAQGIMVAVHSPTLPALLSHLGYEGTPGLWYLLLWLGRFLPPWWDAKLWTALITAATLYVLFYLLDLPWPMAFLYATGVELATYSFMSRSYGLSVLLFLLFGCFERRWRRQPDRRTNIALSLVLFFLTQTNVHSVLIGAAIFCYLAGENLLKRRPVNWLPLVSLGAGAMTAVLEVLPPPNLGPWAPWSTSGAMVRFPLEAVWLVLRMILPFYGPVRSAGAGNVFGGPWLYGLLQERAWASAPAGWRIVIALGIAVLLVLTFYLLFRYVRRLRIRAVPVVGALAVAVALLAALATFKYPLELEHMNLLIPYALALYAAARRPAGGETAVLAWGLLGVQFLGALNGVYTAAAVPYDGTPAVVQWIEAHGWESYLARSDIAVFPDPSASTLTLYGGLPRGAYAVTAGRFETYTPWDKREPLNPLAPPAPALPGRLPGAPGPYLMLTYYPLGRLEHNAVHCVLLARFPDGPWVHWQGSPGALLYLVRARDDARDVSSIRTERGTGGS